MKTATVYDVAKRAGVSRGTVDRVIFNRGRVSQKTVEKVREAIRELNYSANPSASALASKQIHCFACLIPQHQKGEYWDVVDEGFKHGLEEITFCNVDLRMYYYDQNDIESYRKMAAEILELRPRGVITNAVFKEAVTEFSYKLKDLAIPMAFIDNKYDDLDFDIYCGVDPYNSGQLGAYLLTVHQKVESVAMIRVVRDSGKHADPNAPRRHGFVDYIADHFPDSAIYTLFIDPSSSESIASSMDRFASAHPEVRHYAVTNSRLFLIANWLKDNYDPERVVVGFDDLEGNLKAMREGLVDFLVTKAIPGQTNYLLTNFVRNVIYSQPPKVKNNYVHMDVLSKMNCNK